jgi:hypothetical protein
MHYPHIFFKMFKNKNIQGYLDRGEGEARARIFFYKCQFISVGIVAKVKTLSLSFSV